MEKRLMIGEVFERLTVIEELPKQGKNRYFLCKCICGGETRTQYGTLTKGISKSCGCLQKECASKQGGSNKKHGLTRSKIYNIWNAMLSRCYNTSDKGFKNYGGRGITVCNEWRENFINFFNDMGEPPKGMHIDRKENNIGYCKENCRWVPRTINNRNRRTSINIMFKGELTHIEEVAKEIGIKSITLRARIRSGHFNADQLINEPLHAKPSSRTNNR